MATFWGLFKESVIVQGCLTVLPLLVACYLWATGQELPVDLIELLRVVIAFWMGSKTQHLIEKVREP